MSDSTKTVIVTGGVGGLGSVMCEKFAEAGNRVYALDLDKERGESMEVRMREKGYDFSFIQMDLTSEEDWAKAVASIVRNVNSIDVLINNAGINIRKPIEEMNIDEWNTMMRVNTGSVFLGCKYVIPVMKEQHDGVIINMSSVCGLVGHKYTPEAYTASKGAVTMLTKAVASRYAQFGIRSNSIHPSTVDTPLVQKLFENPERKAERLGEVPLGRLCSADDVANAAVFLASEKASFINGLAMSVDGGVTCY